MSLLFVYFGTETCTISEGMDSPSNIPDEQIVVDDEQLAKPDQIRPNNKNPFVIDSDTAKIKVWLMSVPISSFQLTTRKNVDTLTVWYLTTTNQKKLVVQVG